jgi:hypothetical protein
VAVPILMSLRKNSTFVMVTPVVDAAALAMKLTCESV